MAAFKDAGHHWWAMCDACELAWFIGDQPEESEASSDACPALCEHCSTSGRRELYPMPEVSK